MTKKKPTKRALLLSILSLIMCASMLIGSTFAWFTDSVSSGNNRIVAGNLDIEFEYYDGSDWKSVDGATELFSGELWEPGHTEVIYLKLSNLGSLALKYQLGINIVSETAGINVANESFKLSDFIYMGVVEDVNGENASYSKREDAVAAVRGTGLISTGYTKSGAMTADADNLYLAVVVYMPEYVGNEANAKSGTVAPEINLGVNLVATQATVENDSFGSDYDAGATDPVVDEGTYGGIYWTLTESGRMTVSPAAIPAPDANSKAEYEVGVWREAVVYNSKGDATAIGGYPYDVNAVKSLVIHEGVTSIGSFTAKFPNLTGEVVIPASVTYIGQEAFQNTSVTKLTFAEGGTEALCIAPGAFKNLDIEELVLPADRPAIHIHCWAFNDCAQLKHVTIPANVTTFSAWTHVDYCGMDYVNGWDSQIFARCNALEKITFGSQTVHDLFFNAAGNQNNINAIGSVTIEIQ